MARIIWSVLSTLGCQKAGATTSLTLPLPGGSSSNSWSSIRTPTSTTSPAFCHPSSCSFSVYDSFAFSAFGYLLVGFWCRPMLLSLGGCKGSSLLPPHPFVLLTTTSQPEHRQAVPQHLLLRPLPLHYPFPPFSSANLCSFLDSKSLFIPQSPSLTASSSPRNCLYSPSLTPIFLLAVVGAYACLAHWVVVQIRLFLSSHVFGTVTDNLSFQASVNLRLLPRLRLGSLYSLSIGWLSVTRMILIGESLPWYVSSPCVVISCI